MTTELNTVNAEHNLRLQGRVIELNDTEARWLLQYLTEVYTEQLDPQISERKISSGMPAGWRPY